MFENLHVIGHRGVRKVSSENTIAAYKAAVESGVDAVEVDLRSTSDGIVVLCHNENLSEMYGVDKNILELTYKQIESLQTKNNEKIPTLDDLLKMNLNVPIKLDVKETCDINEVAKLLHDYPSGCYIISTFYWEKARALARMKLDVSLSIATYKHPFRAIALAKELRAEFITIPVYLLNPFTYLACRRTGLKIMVYQNYLPFLLTSTLFVRIIWFLYPGIIIDTDRPDKIVPLLKSK